MPKSKSTFKWWWRKKVGLYGILYSGENEDNAKTEKENPQNSSKQTNTENTKESSRQSPSTENAQKEDNNQNNDIIIKRTFIPGVNKMLKIIKK